MSNPPGQPGWGEPPPYGRPGQPDREQPGPPPPGGYPSYDQPGAADPYGSAPDYREPNYSPTYGRYDQPPEYGQQPPEYGQQPPEYGQQPGYGQQPPPEYGQQPGYGQQPPEYGQPAYGQPEYGGTRQYPPSEYGQQQYPADYNAPGSGAGYGAPASGAGYGAPASGAGYTPPGSGAGYGGYSAPPTAPLPGYGDPGQGGGAYPAYPGPGGPGGPGGQPAKKGRGGLVVGVVVGVVVLLLCVGGGIGGAMLLSGDDPSPTATRALNPTTGPTTAGPSTDGPSTSSNSLETRTEDSEPLSLSEFSQSTYSLPSGQFVRTGQDTSTSCGAAVDGKGDSVASSLGCSQAVSVTAVNAANGCVVTFGALNMPDTAAATSAETSIAGGTAGSFVPRRHGAAAEGRAGLADWWYYRKAYGHWLVFASGAYANGKVAANDATITACDKDFLALMVEKLDERR